MPKRLVAACAAVLVAGATLAGAVSQPAGADVPIAAPGGSYVPVAPNTAGWAGWGLTPHTDLGVKVAGVGGIPDTVSAVVVNAIATQSSTSGTLVVFDPAKGSNGATTVNFVPHNRVAMQAIAGVDSLGYVGVRISTQAFVDIEVVGYFTDADHASRTAGLFNPLRPARIMDTRTKLGDTAPGPHGTTNLQVVGRGGVPISGVEAVLVNVTVTAPTALGYVESAAAGSQTFRDTVDFVPHETRSNRAIIPISPGGRISFRNGAGTTQLIVDVMGYFTNSRSTAGGAYFVPSGPKRILDSRTAGAPKWTKPGTANSIPVTVDHGGSGLAPSMRSVTPTTAVVLAITSVRPKAGGLITVYPGLTPRPATSDLNLTRGALTNTSAVAGIGNNGAVNLYSSAAGDVVIETSGYFVRAPATPTPSGMWSVWDQTTFPAKEPLAPAVRTNSIHDVTSIIQFRTGSAFAARPDGSVVSWTPPDPPAWQPDSGHPLDSSPSVQTVDWLTNVQALATAGTSSDTGYALRKDGSVWSWGANFNGDLGQGDAPSAPGPVHITDVTRIGDAEEIGYAIKTDGTLWAWGRNDKGQLGDGSTDDRNEPVQVASLSGIVAAGGDGSVSYAIDSAGHLWRWGMVSGTNAPSAPTQIAVACGSGRAILGTVYSSYELCTDGTVWRLDTAGNPSELQQLPDLDGIVAIAPGVGFPLPGVLALRNDGTVWRYNSDTRHYDQEYGLSNVTTIGGDVLSFYAATG